ncbi:MAG: alpha/beta fold hydrolase [Nocardioidaceae bacterium]
MTVPLPGTFEQRLVEVGTAPAVTINTVSAGAGPPVLFLHGYPQSHLIWHHVAPALATRYTVVLTDLRGYGDSSKPDSAPDHAPYSKRAMATDQHGVMRALGFDRYAVVGHDRGARVAHRLALDFPDAVLALAALDIVPTHYTFSHVDATFGLGYYHWFFLAAGNGIPERLIGHDPEFWIRARMTGRHHGGTALDEAAIDEYVRCFSDPRAIHASCEDYRAAASIDLEHDAADLADGRTLTCPTLALWGAHSFVGRSYDVLSAWRGYATTVEGEALPCDHYVPEEAPAETTARLTSFLDKHVRRSDATSP